MGNPTRFPAGVSNNRAGSIMGNLPVADRNNLAIYQNDFFQYAAGDWTVVAGGAGSGSALSSTILGGALAIGVGFGSQALINNFIGGLIMLVITSPKLTGLVLVTVPFIVVPLILMGRSVRGLSRKSQDRVADTSALRARAGPSPPLRRWPRSARRSRCDRRAGS